MAPPSAANMTGVRKDPDTGRVVVDQTIDGNVFSTPLDDLAHTFVMRAAPIIGVSLRTDDGSDKRPMWEVRRDIAIKLNAVYPVLDGDADDAPRVAAPEPKRDPIAVAAPTDDATELAKLLVRLTGGGTVDADGVRAIVKPMLDERETAMTTAVLDLITSIERPIVNVIQVAGREPIEMTGQQHAAFADLLTIIGAGCHVWIVGPPGTGKSTLAHNVADALQLPYASMGCGADMGRHDLLGFIDAQGNYRATEFRKVYEQGGVFLLDEIDAASPEILVSMNDALANGHCAFPDGMVKRSDDFRCIAAANTYGTGATDEYVGRAAIDVATIDRFVMLHVGIDESLEMNLAKAIHPTGAEAFVAKIRGYRANVAAAGLKVILSPRAVFDGCKLLAAGMPESKVIELRVTRGMDAATVRKVIGR